MNVPVTTTKVTAKTRKLRANWKPDFGDPVVWAHFKPEELSIGDLIVLSNSRSGRRRRTQGIVVDVTSTPCENGTSGAVLWSDGSTTLIGVAQDTRHVSITKLSEWEEGKVEEMTFATTGKHWADLHVSDFTEYAQSSTLYSILAQTISDEIDKEILEDFKRELSNV